MPGVATSPATEAVLTTAPDFCCSITGSTWRRPRKTPLTLTAMTWSNIASSYSAVCCQVALDAGVVEEAVDLAVGVERGLDVIRDIGRFGDVGGDERRLAALLPDDPGGRLAARRVAVDDDHLGARLGKGERGGAADAVAPRR